MKRYALTLLTILIASTGMCQTRLKPSEKKLINSSNDLMYVLQIDNIKDARILRAKSMDFTLADIKSKDFATLAIKMIVTVNDPNHQGVGIAGPQVGLNRRVIAVQRFDKEGEPFEVYANITYSHVGEECQEGPEGCLSVPDRRETVSRYSKIKITYINTSTYEPQTEVVEGFTAVIFQHEIDHLEGILYIDRI